MEIKAYNINIFLGLKESYDGVQHTIDEVYEVCDEFVNEYKDCVSVTPTNFRYVGGSEDGAVIGFISYPRFPRKKREIKKRALILAKILMKKFKQERVSVVTPKKTILLSS